jgi:hypothetical protein
MDSVGFWELLGLSKAREDIARRRCTHSISRDKNIFGVKQIALK